MKNIKIIFYIIFLFKREGDKKAIETKIIQLLGDNSNAV